MEGQKKQKSNWSRASYWITSDQVDGRNEGNCRCRYCAVTESHKYNQSGKRDAKRLFLIISYSLSISNNLLYSLIFFTAELERVGTFYRFCLNCP